MALHLVDVDRGRLLEVVVGRTATTVDTWLAARPVDWLRSVTTVAIDPHKRYANGVKARLGHATLVVDPSMPCAWPTPPSTTSAAARSRRRWAPGPHR